MKHPHTVLAATLSLGLLSSSSVLAADGRCDNFNIKINNQTGYAVNVSKVEYFDFDSNAWRTEAVIDQLLQESAQWTWTRNLQHVGDKNTKLRITYKPKPDGFNLSALHAAQTTESSAFTCADNGASPAVVLQ